MTGVILTRVFLVYYEAEMKSIHKILVQQFLANTGALTLTGALILLTVGFDAIAPWPFKVLIDNVLTPQPIEQGTVLGSLLSWFNSRELIGFFVVFMYFVSTFSLANFRRKLKTCVFRHP